MEKHVSSVAKTCFLSIGEFRLQVSSQNLQLLHLQMPLCIPALIIVIAFLMVFQNIPLITYKNYKTLLLLLLHVPLVRHI